ncbi:hypothetical protein ACS78_27415 [Priestia megaterium]|uniref:DUF6119 family protein n=1 Tax=Priestia megaterium TaxID=1404 RepID=UPI0006828B53|nr:DUF6119 family protein [Priestia megaterium]KNH14830.1 hypothetical protein ACS78_27415 [Priestia megaterium]
MFIIAKNKKLIIYLLNSNENNFKTYIREENRDKLKRHYIDKQKISGNVDRGIIFIHEDPISPPDWVGYLSDLSEKKDIKVPGKKVNKAILFLTIKGVKKRTFAIVFGHGSSLLKHEYIVQNFGLKVSKSMLSIEQLISIDSTAFSNKMFNTKKQSSKFLIREKLLEYGTQNIVKNVYGIHKELDKRFSLGGKDSLNFNGNIDLLLDLSRWLNYFADIFDADTNNLGIPEELVIATKSEKEALDNKLGQKILDVISTYPITKRQTSLLKLVPNAVLDLEDFNGFFISGLGYKQSDISSDFSIDEVNFFDRLQRQLKPNSKNIKGILSKLKTDKIHGKSFDNGDLTEICTIYESINYEVKYNSKDYILVSGIWYKIDKQFYSSLKKEIDNIPSPECRTSIKFIGFNPQKHVKQVVKNNKIQSQLSEGAYNDDFALKNGILKLDQEDYSPDSQTMKQYGLKTKSSIEICDALDFNSKEIQFIHIKRHSGGASGTSHLLFQSLVSAHAFLNDNESVTDHINEVIKKFNKRTNRPYTILNEFKYKNQKKEIFLVIIDKTASIKKAKDVNSKLLSLLKMISLRETVTSLEQIGFKCYLKFVPGNL